MHSYAYDTTVIIHDALGYVSFYLVVSAIESGSICLETSRFVFRGVIVV